MLEKTNKKLAFYDQLTSLPNRQKIIIDISKNNPCACVIFNIDEFKEINDFFGTENGDKILKDIASWFSKSNYETYRIDGDEFAILFYDDDCIKSIETKVKDILNLFEKEIFYIEEEKIQIAFSAGIAKVKYNLLTKADIAVHYAKEQKIKISTYKEDGNIEQKYKQNIAMATAIREALNDKRIICHYQPILDQRTGKIYKYETLVRMLTKEGEIIPPIEFLEISKKTKLYPYITREVLHQACNTFKDRKENFSINLSIDDIKDTNIVNEIIKTIIETKTASRITFEILESEEIENYQEVRNFTKRIKEIGSKIAVDDFGTGYSNFEHILKLNIDYIKIDGSLIKGMENNKKNKIIVETIVDFAKKIGSKTIAEFVYNEASYLISKEIGIDFLQGFYIGKPSENLLE